VELSVSLRTWLQIGAGLLIIVFGLAQVGAPGFRRTAAAVLFSSTTPSMIFRVCAPHRQRRSRDAARSSWT
jgi:hypothetical protein